MSTLSMRVIGSLLGLNLLDESGPSFSGNEDSDFIVRDPLEETAIKSLSLSLTIFISGIELNK